MAELYEILKAKFLKTYANLPDDEREQVIVIVDNEPYAWNRVNVEVNADTKKSKKMLNKMRLLGIL